MGVVALKAGIRYNNDLIVDNNDNVFSLVILLVECKVINVIVLFFKK